MLCRNSKESPTTILHQSPKMRTFFRNFENQPLSLQLLMIISETSNGAIKILIFCDYRAMKMEELKALALEIIERVVLRGWKKEIWSKLPLWKMRRASPWRIWRCSGIRVWEITVLTLDDSRFVATAANSIYIEIYKGDKTRVGETRLSALWFLWYAVRRSF